MNLGRCQWIATLAESLLARVGRHALLVDGQDRIPEHVHLNTGQLLSMRNILTWDVLCIVHLLIFCNRGLLLLINQNRHMLLSVGVRLHVKVDLFLAEVHLAIGYRHILVAF